MICQKMSRIRRLSESDASSALNWFGYRYQRPHRFGELVLRCTFEFLPPPQRNRNNYAVQGLAGGESLRSPPSALGAGHCQRPVCGQRVPLASTVPSGMIATAMALTGADASAFFCFSGRPVSGSRFLAVAISRMRSSVGKGGGTLAWWSLSHLKVPSHGGSLAGGKGTMASISGTLGLR